MRVDDVQVLPLRRNGEACHARHHQLARVGLPSARTEVQDDLRNRPVAVRVAAGVGADDFAAVEREVRCLYRPVHTRHHVSGRLGRQRLPVATGIHDARRPAFVRAGRMHRSYAHGQRHVRAELTDSRVAERNAVARECSNARRVSADSRVLAEQGRDGDQRRSSRLVRLRLGRRQPHREVQLVAASDEARHRLGDSTRRLDR